MNYYALTNDENKVIAVIATDKEVNSEEVRNKVATAIREDVSADEAIFNGISDFNHDYTLTVSATIIEDGEETSTQDFTLTPCTCY